MTSAYEEPHWEDYSRNWHDDSNEPCAVCHEQGYCNPVIHAEYDARIATLELVLSSHPCRECGGVVSCLDDWGEDGTFLTPYAWAQCSDKRCARIYTFLYTVNLEFIGLYRGYLGSSEGKYRNLPIDLSMDDIPF